MASEKPPRPFLNLPGPPALLLRLGLIVASIVAMGGAIALAFIPAAKGLGVASQKLENAVGCTGSEDIQFPRFPERSTVYASNGAVLANIFLDENRTVVGMKDIGRNARKAVLGIEDYRFYTHGAIDLHAIVRAFVDNLRAGHITQGGSTITQQLVKNITGNTQETLRRKLHEMCQAIAVERKYSKNQILDLYMNEIYFGHGLYGIDTAAQGYFGVPASKLTLTQAATIAGIVAAPGSFDPIANPKAALARRNQVLARLATIRCVPHVGCVNPARMQKLQSKPLGLASNAGKPPPAHNPFFVQYITGRILRDADGE